jgi:hypothetical protein
MLGQAPHKELEHGRVLHAEIVVALKHRELIKVGEECASGPVR